MIINQILIIKSQQNKILASLENQKSNQKFELYFNGTRKETKGPYHWYNHELFYVLEILWF